jgi:CRP-like cAMP-binding protein
LLLEAPLINQYHVQKDSAALSDRMPNSIGKDFMQLLNPFFEPFQCEVGTLVLKQGTPADYLYLVTKGKVDISYKPYDGSTMTVSHVEAGGLFGWSAVVGSENYTSSAVAIEPLEAMRIRGSDIRKYCREHPDQAPLILEQLALSVSSRWQHANEQVKIMLSQIMKEQK